MIQISSVISGSLTISGSMNFVNAQETASSKKYLVLDGDEIKYQTGSMGGGSGVVNYKMTIPHTWAWNSTLIPEDSLPVYFTEVPSGQTNTLTYARYYQATGSDTLFSLQKNGSFLAGYTASSTEYKSASLNTPLSTGDRLGLVFDTTGSSAEDFTFTLYTEYSDESDVLTGYKILVPHTWVMNIISGSIDNPPVFFIQVPTGYVNTLTYARYYQATGVSQFSLQKNGTLVQEFTSSNTYQSASITPTVLSSGDRLGLNFTSASSDGTDFAFTLFIEYSGSII